MRRMLGNAVSVAVSFLRLAAMRLTGHKIRFHAIERLSPNVVLEISRSAICRLGSRIRIHSGSKIKVRTGGKLVIGDNVSMNYNCMIICHESVMIGNEVEFGPGVLVYDHDHDFRCNGGIKAGKFLSSPVIIGEESWIGAGTIILRGTTIGRRCVIGAGSIVHGIIPDDTMLVQKKEDTTTIIIN